jgi:tetratricopeptide (TPR) repeat protein
MSAPVIVEVGIDPPGEYAWNGWYGHYLLVVAYDDAQRQIWVYDSWFGTSEEPGANATTDGRIMSYEDLDRYWRQFNRNYLALFRPEQAAAVAAVIGPDMDDTVMWQRSLAMAQAEAEAEPENAFLWFNLGTNYNAAGDYERAATAFDQARAIGLPWRMLWYQFGPYEAYYEVGRYEDVVVLADATLETQGGQNVEETYYFKGLAQAALGDVDGARVSLERSIALNPNFSRAAEALVSVSSNQ